MKRAKYQWGAKEYLSGFKQGEIRIYKEKFPWRSLHSIASRLKREFGVVYLFKTLGDERIISRAL